MTWTIISGGQTGVDQGAMRGALDAGLGLDGWAPLELRTEAGAVPGDLARYLHEHISEDYDTRTDTNVQISDLVLLVVENELRPLNTPGTKLTYRLAQSQRKPYLIVSGPQHAQAVKLWLRTSINAVAQAGMLQRKGSYRLMVAGPRKSKWPDGERMARALIGEVFRRVKPEEWRQLELPL